MRVPRNNFTNTATNHPQDESGFDEAQAEARRAEEIAQRRAYLEQKIFQAREAKRRAAEMQAQQQANQAARQPVAPSQPVAAPLNTVAADTRAETVMVQSPRQTPSSVPAEMTALPAWQRAFSLAPNVRFSRTPESQIPRRKGPDQEPAAPRAAAVQAPAIAPLQQQPQAAPRTVEAPIAGARSVPAAAPVRPAVPQAAAPIVASIAQQSVSAEIVQPIVDPVAGPSAPAASQLANLSDFAFWDVMPVDDGLTISPLSLRPPVATPVAAQAAPRVEIPVEIVFSRYRIIEWREVLPPAPVNRVAVLLESVSRGMSAPMAEEAPAQPVAFVAEEPAAAAPAAHTVSIEAAPVEIASQPVVIVAENPQPDVEQSTVPAEPVVQVANPRAFAIAPRRDRPVAPAPMEWRPVAVTSDGDYQLPPRELLQEPVARTGVIMTQETLEQNAGLLESVLEDFGVKGEIIHVRPGPVVTLYEFEPAPGVKSSRVIGLADDIARSMSALSARVAVVPGRNVIGIELPNVVRETVYFRELIEAQSFESTEFKLALCLGKNIGGEPIIAELAKMPHLLVAGTTGSGKSVAINTMILSLLYRLTPEQCRLIMVDPKMLELSVYDGIPHLLTPVVTDPKKAVMALKWAVREMEDRYRKMSRLSVRNIDGYNSRVRLAREKGETIHVNVQTGFDKGTGAPIEESQELDLTPMPYIVVIVDEMADLMMVAGKEIEGAIQRLAQMARAAGIHLIMATQRPSVDVITGTIKANFPTRISFQVTSKIDSRTILGEQGAEQLLGQGDMLHMAGGGRISRVHGPFVSDEEVEKVVAHLKAQGRPEYLDTVTADEDEDEEADDADNAVFDKTAMGSEDGDDLYEQAIKVVMRDKKCSTSYIQRRLGIGYNRAASLVERMEKEGLVGAANHVGKREIISGNRDAVPKAADEE